MKIVSWNLQNISFKKLGKTFAPLFQSYGLGNTVLDYIVKVVIGGDQWSGVVSPIPPDLFVVIELKTGGTAKGGAVTEKCGNTLAELRNALNAAVSLYGHNPADYRYDFVIPKITGRHETVGFLYNTRSLVPVATDVERDLATDTFLRPRTPLYFRFNLADNSKALLQVSGIHAPPPTSGNLRLRRPIDWCTNLASTSTGLGTVNAYFTGDFNCQPSDTYTSATGSQVGWTAAMTGFRTSLPQDTLSSLKRTYVPSATGKAAYLSSSYDNTFFKVGQNTTIADQDVPDLIGGAQVISSDPNTEPVPLYPGHGLGVFNAYRMVSDHLPVVTEFSVLS